MDYERRRRSFNESSHGFTVAAAAVCTRLCRRIAVPSAETNVVKMRLLSDPLRSGSDRGRVISVTWAHSVP
jgi:hypothetical protein